jgi:hypothetical protein
VHALILRLQRSCSPSKTSCSAGTNLIALRSAASNLRTCLVGLARAGFQPQNVKVVPTSHVLSSVFGKVVLPPIAVHAELVATCGKNLHRVSHDVARNARKDITDAVERLEAFDWIMILPSMNIRLFTMAADVPLRLGGTTSAAVLKASKCAAFPTPNAKHSAMCRVEDSMPLALLEVDPVRIAQNGGPRPRLPERERACPIAQNIGDAAYCASASVPGSRLAPTARLSAHRDGWLSSSPWGSR